MSTVESFKWIPHDLPRGFSIAVQYLSGNVPWERRGCKMNCTRNLESDNSSTIQLVPLVLIEDVDKTSRRLIQDLRLALSVLSCRSYFTGPRRKTWDMLRLSMP